MRIVHFSDWHWFFVHRAPKSKLPEADLYICTGDMFDNGPMFSGVVPFPEWPNAERRYQLIGAAEFVINTGGFKNLLGSPDAPVVIVRGNHDFAELTPLFAGTTLVHEFVDNECVILTIAGVDIRVTGHRGIPYINGCWSDEESRADLIDRVRKMPDADIFLTHYAPSGLGLDGVRGTHYGLDGMTNHMVYAMDNPVTESGRPARLHCFGHIHECGGKTVEAGGILHSNAATTWNMIDGDPSSGWRVITK